MDKYLWHCLEVKQEEIKIYVKNNQEQGNILGDERIFTRNVVYKEVLTSFNLFIISYCCK